MEPSARTANAAEAREDSGLLKAPSNAKARRFGRYVLCGEIASGGMATVHLARTESTAGFRKWVAIKTIHPHLAGEQRFVAMFLNEARLAARLDHPNIGTVFDFGEQDGTYFIAMEYLRGEPLSVVLGAARDAGALVPWPIAVRIVTDAARGLQAAHELRDANDVSVDLVHRDVSPQNIFVLFDGVSKVVDFGVARSRDNLGDRTATGEMKGKLGYMSPEQVLAKPIDRRIDVFALGVVLWEMLSGRRLFRRDNDGATIQAILMDPVPSLDASGLPPGLAEVVMRALDRDPAARFATAEEMARALDRVLATRGQTVGAMEVSDYMRSLFRDRIAQREAMLRVFDGAPDPTPAFGSLAGAVPVAPVPALASASAGHDEVSQLRSRGARSPLALIAAGLVAVMIVAGGGTFAIMRRRAKSANVPPVTPAATIPLQVAPASTAPTTAGVQPTESAPSPAPAAQPSWAPSAVQPESDVAPSANARGSRRGQARENRRTNSRPAAHTRGSAPNLMRDYEN